MKPAPNTLVRESNLPGRQIEFGIGDPRWVMQTQAELYSDVTTAVIREYSTNAYDAHVMAGHTDPIEVTLPSVLDPIFRVKDHGVGMNFEIFETVYTQFGISDKRGDNTTNGKLGYGSKSGVAYTSSFTVVSVRDGIKTEAIVERMPDWSIIMTVTHEDFTDEPNGTEIQFTVHNVEEFNRKAQDFYKFWLPGRVLINGKPSEHHVGELITEGFYYSADWNSSYVVMGNVPYRINNPEALFYNTKMNRVNFVAYVDDIKMVDGAEPVEHTPSREDLKYTDRTKNTLQAIINKFEQQIVDKAQADVNKATSHAEAYTAWSKWRDTLGGHLFGDLTYQGDKFQPEYPVIGHRHMVRGYGQANQTVRTWSVESTQNTIFVTDFDISVSSSVRKKVKEYTELMDWKYNYLLFTKATSFDSKWVDWSTVRMVTWKEIKKACPTVKTSNGGGSGVNWNSGRVQGSWDYFTKTGKEVEQTIPSQGDVYWISLQTAKSYNVTQILSLLRSDAVVIEVPANRLEKFNRENPTVENIITWAKTQVNLDGASLLSDDAKKVFGIDYDRRRWLERLDTDLLDDPELVNLKSLIARQGELTAEYKRHSGLANHLRMGYNSFKEYAPSIDDQSFYKKYPLLRTMSVGYHAPHEDIYTYMNAKHRLVSEGSV